MRIIPTRMGTSEAEWRRKYIDRDHPHAYGDKFLYVYRKEYLIGSSPRVWGQGDKKWGLGQSPRIIPTRMGTRITCWKSLLSTGDHPHAYGDKACLLLYPYHNQGSSPRVWGQVTTSTDTPGRDRIIPTRMGTSLYDYLLCFHKRDHPHAYGDKYLLMILVILMEGSSPRVWGQVYYDMYRNAARRIIPTRMGTSYHIDRYPRT